jgi:hypothetical protein
MNGSPMRALDGNGRAARTACRSAGQLFAMAAVLAALLFGLAGLIGAIGYLVSVTRYR